MTKQIPPGYKQTKVGIIPYGWGRFELNEVLSISSEKFNPITNIENRRCIELEHLSQETGKNLGFVNSNEQQSVKNVFIEGQVLFGKLRPYLKKFWKATFDGVCSSEIWVINGKKVSNNYLFFLVQTNKFIQVANVSSGSKMPRADWSYMSEVPFIVPLSHKEQEKIAEILSTWDEAINKQEQLIGQKQVFKKGIMQQIFSQKLRFKDDKGNVYPAWQTKKLGDICEFKKGVAFTIDQLVDGDIPVIAGGKNPAYFHNMANRYGENITISSSGASAGYVNYFNTPIFASDSFTITAYDNAAVTKCIYFYLLLKQEDIFRQQSGGAQPHIYPKDIQIMKFKNPDILEQSKIASFLTNIDDEITKQTEILEQLKLQKQSLMQKLLTGQVRIRS